MKVSIPSKVNSLISEIDVAFGRYLDLEETASKIPNHLPAEVQKCINDKLYDVRKECEKLLEKFAKMINTTVSTNMYWITFIGKNKTEITVTHQTDRVFVEVLSPAPSILNPKKMIKRRWDLGEKRSLSEALLNVYLLAFLFGWLK